MPRESVRIFNAKLMEKLFSNVGGTKNLIWEKFNLKANALCATRIWKKQKTSISLGVILKSRVVKKKQVRNFYLKGKHQEIQILKHSKKKEIKQSTAMSI